MKFFTRIAILLYVTAILFVSCCIILFAQQALSFVEVVRLLYLVSISEQLRLFFTYVGIFMLLLNYLFYRMYFSNVPKERIIAFDNPSGRVSLSVGALDDLIRKKVSAMPDVKDVKSKIKVSRKGLQIKIRLALKTEVNIPEITSKVQDVVTNKIQDIIGIEEPVNVSIYIGKIIPEKFSSKKTDKKIKSEEEKESNIPFQGYRA